MKPTRTDLIPRVLTLVAGLFILAFGIALSTKSGLGVSPSSSLAYLLSEFLPLSMGNFTMLMNLIYMLIQLVLLRRGFKPVRLLQLAVVFLFGYFTDFTLALVAPIQIENYLLQLLLCLVSCVIMGLGIYLEVKPNVISMASEGAFSVIAAKTGREFGRIKIINDCICVVASVAISLLVFGEVRAVREGTVIAAILVGLCTQFWARLLPLPWLAAARAEKSAESPEETAAREHPLVVTIEREFGSGGHEIGKALAEQLGIRFYDYELIQKVAEETGLPYERVKHGEEQINALAYALYHQTYAYTNEMSTQDAIFEAQKKVLRDIAARESCVIVGRLGSFILKDRPNSMHIFISAKEEFRAGRIAAEYRVSPEKALDMVKKVDGLRANYCRHFTGTPWGLARHYRLCLDTSAYGIPESLRIIEDSLKDFRSISL